MKKQLLFASFALASMIAISQPSNVGFENWTGIAFSTAEDPNGWVSNNVLSSSLLGSNPVALTKVTGSDKHSGTYAAKLSTVKLSSVPSGWSMQDTVGFMATGKVIPSAPYLFLGYPETQKPSTFNFWYKYTPNGNDTASCLIVLLKRNGANRDTVGVGYAMFTTTVSTYTQYMLPIIYNTSVTASPDTAIIAFSSSGDNLPKVGSALYIDDLTFGNLSGIKETSGAEIVSVYPNPAVREINFSFATDKAQTVAVFSIAGHYVGTYNVADKKLKITTEKLASGVYTFFVKDNNEGIIDTGRVTVTK